MASQNNRDLRLFSTKLKGVHIMTIKEMHLAYVDFRQGLSIKTMQLQPTKWA